MHLIVGLGNYGPKYQFHRHNIGFMAIDVLAHNLGDGKFRTEHKSKTAKIRINGQQVLIAKPQTYMNLSGGAVQALISYYDIEQSNILVVHDEVDLAFGSLKFQYNRGHGGHNGVRDIHKHLGKEYSRLGIGVSRPPNDKMDVADYLLADFSKQEMKQLPEILSLAGDGIENFVLDGLETTANKFNQRTAL